MHHAVEIGHLLVRIRDDGEVDGVALCLLDVRRPALVGRHGIHGEPDGLDPALVELGLEAGHIPELGRAHGREVLGMREEHGPAVADPVVEVDRALRAFGREVRCAIAQSQ
jgi:hypothetical protein